MLGWGLCCEMIAADETTVQTGFGHAYAHMLHSELVIKSESHLYWKVPAEISAL